MNQNFLQPHRFVLTPISPIHIGCGLDYEPTNAVIDEDRGFLYSFNPGVVALTADERRQLLAAVSKGDIRDVNAFYDRNIALFRPWADNIVPVCGKAVYQYRKMLNPQGNQKNTQFCFQRMISSRAGEAPLPMIPGSSVKGMISTALQDRLNGGRDIDAKEAKGLLGGDFDKSPLRFLKVGDFESSGTGVAARIYYAVRLFKKDAAYAGKFSGFEAVVPGGYRQFTGDVVLTHAQNTKGVKNVYEDAARILKDLHAYSSAVMMSQLVFYKKAAPLWLESVARLLKAIEPAFESGRAALVRLGKNNGRESKTLHCVDEDTMPGLFKVGALTAFITSDTEATCDAQPFGWAILEVDPQEDLTALKSWCVKSKLGDFSGAVAAEWRSVEAERAERRKVVDAAAAVEAEREARRRQEEREAEERERAKAEMTPEGRSIVELCEALKRAPGTVKPGTDLFIRTKTLLEAAQAWTNAVDKKTLADSIQPLLKAKDMYQGKAGKNFKQQLRQLRGEA